MMPLLTRVLIADGVTDVIVYKPPEEHTNRQNRGFCFVQFDTHKNASDAKRRLERGRIRPWNTELVIDWAETQEEDEDAMKKVSYLHLVGHFAQTVMIIWLPLLTSRTKNKNHGEKATCLSSLCRQIYCLYSSFGIINLLLFNFRSKYCTSEI